MIKKTIIKRAYKSWPQRDTSARFAQAIDVTNDADPVEFLTLPEKTATHENTENSLQKIKDALAFLERKEDKYIEHLCVTTRREIKNLNDLTEMEISQALVMLNQWVENKKKRDAVNENAG